MDAKKMLDQFLNSGMATGVLAGGLGAALLGRSGIGRDLLKVGGLALVGTLAYQAYQRSRQNQGQVPGAPAQPALGETVSGVLQGRSGALGQLGGIAGGVLSNIPGVGDFIRTAEQSPPPADSGFGAQADPQRTEANGLAIMAAMIAAAKADGHIDAQESQKIFEHMDKAGLAADERAFVMNEMAKPVDLDALARLATTPEIAAQMYTASALTIADVNAAEQVYLDKLAQKLRLDASFTQELGRQIAALR
jgi:uncharacterized membrane protein YebE (DUF533 family)